MPPTIPHISRVPEPRRGSSQLVLGYSPLTDLLYVSGNTSKARTWIVDLQSGDVVAELSTQFNQFVSTPDLKAIGWRNVNSDDITSHAYSLNTQYYATSSFSDSTTDGEEVSPEIKTQKFIAGDPFSLKRFLWADILLESDTNTKIKVTPLVDGNTITASTYTGGSTDFDPHVFRVGINQEGYALELKISNQAISTTYYPKNIYGVKYAWVDLPDTLRT